MNTMKTYKVVVDVYSTICWYNEKGQFHCEHGPAVEYVDGDKFWYQNNKYHRLDGPAFEYANGDKRWYQNGKLHRLDGPAVEYSDGNKRWFIEGVKYTQAEFKKKVKELKNPKSPCDGKIVTIEGKQYKLQELK